MSRPRARAGAARPPLSRRAGAPLALVELPIASAELGDGTLLPPWLPLTERLEQAFAARVAGLPTATRTLLLVAALDDGGVPAEVLAAAALVCPGGPGLDARAGRRPRATRASPCRSSSTREAAGWMRWESRSNSWTPSTTTIISPSSTSRSFGSSSTCSTTSGK